MNQTELNQQKKVKTKLLTIVGFVMAILVGSFTEFGLPLVIMVMLVTLTIISQLGGFYA